MNKSSLVLAIAVGTIATGCAETRFEAMKAQVVARNVLGDSTGASPFDDGNGSSDDGTRPIDDGGKKKIPPPSQLYPPNQQNQDWDDDDENRGDTFPVKRMCSDRRSEEATNYKRAISENLPIELRINDEVCTSNKTTIDTLVKKDSVTRSELKAICPQLVNASNALKLTLKINGTYSDYDDGELFVLWALNAGTTAGQQADSYCTKRSSPLVIHLKSDVEAPAPIALSSRANGVDFDLLGERNAHQKIRISWFTNRQYAFLALPDSTGQVRGIDQLFGDNTKGPDAAFAANGYAALAKFDANKDQRITSADPVFSKLRLWIDANRDGFGQPSEMVRLADRRLTFIDLAYSDEFSERDRYGNETKMKSVVGYKDGSLDLIFDLWFAY